MITVKIG